MPEVSIIIPVYHAEKYLRECLDSVLGQTLKDIEIICVDDGSTDSSIGILREYGEKDSRLTVLTQENRGAGAARNKGMASAKGKYIAFMDADDYYPSRSVLQTMVRAAELNHVCVCGGGICFDRAGEITPGKEYSSDNCYEKEGIVNYTEVQYDYGYYRYIYERKLLEENNIIFPDYLRYEDPPFFVNAMLAAGRFYALRQDVYCYRHGHGEVLWTDRQINDVICGISDVYELANENSLELLAERCLKRINSDLKYILYDGLKRGTDQKLFYRLMKLNARINDLQHREDLLAPIGMILDSFTGEQNWTQTQIKELQSKLRIADHEIAAIHSSLSYRAGRTVTWLPRKVRGGIRCFQEHGFGYTMRRTLEHLRLIQIKPEPAPEPESEPEQKPGSEQERIYDFYSHLPPDQYEKGLKLSFKRATGEDLDLEDPKTFNEKIQWLKLYDSTPLKTRLADKYLVRDWVREKIGEEYLIPLLGVWDSFDEIDFDKLPDRFVLKANHGSLWNIIVKDKSALDIEDARSKFNAWLQTNYAFVNGGLELHYMNIRPKIIAEAFIKNNEDELYDYKVYCFNGKAESVVYLRGRRREMKGAFYDLEWNRLPFITINRRDELMAPKPVCLDLMVQLSEKLAAGFSFARVDFYILNDGSLKFGEITFTPSNGQAKWDPPEQNRIYGDLIRLPPKSPIPERRV